MLHKIVEQKKKEIVQLRQRLSSQDVEVYLEHCKPTRPFVKSLVESNRSVSVIAEVKKASPSKGLIRENFDPVEIAHSYEEARVDAMSVLTDVSFFQGSTDYLTMIRKTSPVPILRKDFILDPLQVHEARMIGADCILLIAAILEPKQLTMLSELAKEIGLDVLIEVHNREELDIVLSYAQPSILGINNRNLKTFETNLQTTEELISLIPSQIPVVSESGIHSKNDIAYLEQLGVRSVLVGEHFMREKNVAGAVRELVG